MDLSLPFTASIPAVLGVFLSALVLFHLGLVRWWKLGRVGWKKVDYIWLFATAIGLLGATGEVRRTVAPNVSAFARLRQQSTYEDLQREVRFLSSPAFCRVFNKSSFSPPDFDDVQRQFNEVCTFGKVSSEGLPAEAPSRRLDLASLRTRPVVQDAMLLEAYKTLDQAIARYAESENDVAALVAAGERSSLELTLIILSPLLLASALALRITKVTGELRLGA